jgi:hypothetical protein
VTAALGVYSLIFFAEQTGITLMWLSGLSIVLIAVIVGRAFGPIMFSLYGAGLFLVFVYMAGPTFLQSAVLQARGHTVTARIERIAADPAYPASTDDGCRSCAHTHGYVFRTSDGAPVRGYPYGSDKTLHVGDLRPVVIDPERQVDSRSPQEIQLVVNGFFLLIGAVIVYGVCQSSSSAWCERQATKSAPLLK